MRTRPKRRRKEPLLRGRILICLLCGALACCIFAPWKLWASIANDDAAWREQQRSTDLLGKQDQILQRMGQRRRGRRGTNVTRLTQGLASAAENFLPQEDLAHRNIATAMAEQADTQPTSPLETYAAAKAAVAFASSKSHAAAQVRAAAISQRSETAGAPHQLLRCVTLGGSAAVYVASSRVNDDFCDCADGSDEPRTSACAGVVHPHLTSMRNAPGHGSTGVGDAIARFECTRDAIADVHGRVSHRSIPLSHVRDGICDCCDGSDEAVTTGQPMVPGVATMCPNSCAALEAMAAAAADTRRRGLAARAAYVAKASAHSISRAAQEAPHVAFHTLDGKCFTSKTNEYVYRVCLFHSAHQIKGNYGTGTSLGSSWHWKRQRNGDAAAKATSTSVDITTIEGVLTGGAHCAGANIDRSLIISFVCSADGDSLGKVSERSTCVYEVELSTPAACT